MLSVGLLGERENRIILRVFLSTLVKPPIRCRPGSDLSQTRRRPVVWTLANLQLDCLLLRCDERSQNSNRFVQTNPVRSLSLTRRITLPIV
jgi:hypothetical protein